MNDKLSSLQFPCVFPIKVMGLNSDVFYEAISVILKKHLPDIDAAAFTSRLSSGEKYLSITVTCTVQSKEQLDALYQELNDHELVLMTL